MYSEETNAYLIPNSKPEMVTKKRAMFTDDVISDVTITVDNYDTVNDNNDNDWNTEAEKLHHDNLDPKLLQAAQLFVQDLIERAIFEYGKKLATSERQALLHEDTLFMENSGDNAGVINRIREEITRKCRRIYNLFLNCLGHLP